MRHPLLGPYDAVHPGSDATRSHPQHNAGPPTGHRHGGQSLLGIVQYVPRCTYPLTLLLIRLPKSPCKPSPCQTVITLLSCGPLQIHGELIWFSDYGVLPSLIPLRLHIPDGSCFPHALAPL